MNSRSLDFADEVMKATEGKGVDFVLNSLAGEFIPKSISVLRPGGSFFEVGKTGIWDPKKVAEFKPGTNYFVIALDDLTKEKPSYVLEMFREMMKEFESGVLKALPTSLFSIHEAEQAFRYMVQAKHIGKVVVTWPKELEQSQKAIAFDGAYLVTGGAGALGLLASEWLASKGVKRLVSPVGASRPSKPNQGFKS